MEARSAVQVNGRDARSRVDGVFPNIWIRGWCFDVDFDSLVLQIPSALNRLFMPPIIFRALFCFWTG